MIPERSISNIANSARSAQLDEKNPKALASKVQAMFMEILMKSMEETVGADDGLFGGGSSTEIYRGMFREQMSAALGAQLGGALREQLEKGMASGKDGVSGKTASLEGVMSSPQEVHGGVHETQASHETHEMDEDRSLPVVGRVTSEVGWRLDPINGSRSFHKGTDIAAAAGTPIQAVAAGVVIESGAKGTYGNAVVIRTDDGRRMLYAHNQQNFVRVGDRVVRGDAIAAVGATGRATGPHVHFEVTER